MTTQNHPLDPPKKKTKIVPAKATPYEVLANSREFSTGQLAALAQALKLDTTPSAPQEVEVNE